MDKLPPVAQWVAWLIVTHHRLPPLIEYGFASKVKESFLQIGNRNFAIDLNLYYQKAVKAIAFWVKNPKSIEEMTTKEKEQFFSFDNLVLNS